MVIMHNILQGEHCNCRVDYLTICSTAPGSLSSVATGSFVDRGRRLTEM
jgi:hypothetical protein